MKYKFKDLSELPEDERPSSAEFWYDLKEEYLKAENFSDDPKTIAAINEAIELLRLCDEMCEER